MHYFVSFSVLITKHTISIVNEIKELKARLSNIDQKMSLNADFDGDLLTRKVKKLERRLKDLEGNEDI